MTAVVFSALLTILAIAILALTRRLWSRPWTGPEAREALPLDTVAIVRRPSGDVAITVPRRTVEQTPEQRDVAKARAEAKRARRRARNLAQRRAA